MKWQKLGLIFDPKNHILANNCKDYAQSPQALVFDKFVRIYFSTRSFEEQTKMFLSHVSYVDMDLSLSNILKVSNKTVIELGTLGTFDEHGIFPFSVFRNDDKIVAYTCGWSRRVSVPVETSTGYATSNDHGETFAKLGSGPILGATSSEPFLVGDSFVRKYDDAYHMWYMYGTKWVDTDPSKPERVYKIGHAISDDGINWKKDNKQIIEDILDDNECQALPTVIKIKDTYHMYFCYRHAFNFRDDMQKSYRIGYASSRDLINWVRNDALGGLACSKDGFDSEMMCYPNIFNIGQDVYILYNGNQFGKGGFGAAKLLQTI